MVHDGLEQLLVILKEHGELRDLCNRLACIKEDDNSQVLLLRDKARYIQKKYYGIEYGIEGKEK